jgi:hypothetical protein
MYSSILSQHNVLSNIYVSFNLSFITLRKIEIFDENYWLWLPISLYVQNLMNQFSFKLLFLIPFVKL